MTAKHEAWKAREAALSATLRYAVDAWPEFDTDDAVNGGDLVDWYALFRERAKAALKTKGKS